MAMRRPTGVPQEVAEWRRALLVGAGFGTDAARSIAEDGEYDLHELLRLVDRGCPPELALRILAPL